jgi:hypothetical protein
MEPESQRWSRPPWDRPMTMPSPEDADRIVRRILFTEWRRQIAAGHITEAGLLAIRPRLNAAAEFRPGPDHDLIDAEVSDTIAARRRIDPSDMPGARFVSDQAPRENVHPPFKSASGWLIRTVALPDGVVAAYLDRLGVPRPMAAMPEALRTLQVAHLEQIPFENLSVAARPEWAVPARHAGGRRRGHRRAARRRAAVPHRAASAGARRFHGHELVSDAFPRLAFHPLDDLLAANRARTGEHQRLHARPAAAPPADNSAHPPRGTSWSSSSRARSPGRARQIVTPAACTARNRRGSIECSGSRIMSTGLLSI